jgi:hypothetical protein
MSQFDEPYGAPILKKEPMNKYRYQIFIAVLLIVIIALTLSLIAQHDPNLIDRRYYEGFGRYEDNERDVTCWYYGDLKQAAISCLPNNLIDD